ncbi:GNAT family N-acetyltransferase [Streptomyces sp. NPDC047829]|uniref:GNAT family N-acetyltransferase n=1 Tax=Streptomyces sp. NPDC047829 TaxID=3154609 RepID=UPI0033F74CA3
MNAPISIHAANEHLLQQYQDLATRSFGHPVRDIALLHPHADIRVAVRAGTVIAGGLGLLLPQYFGGRPVPSALLGAGCVAPEERGEGLAARLMQERLHALQEQGAVIASIWTQATSYARRLGFEAPTTACSWTVATDDLRQTDTAPAVTVHAGNTDDSDRLQRELARCWNGPVARPPWWTAWTRAKSPNPTHTYRFSHPGAPPSGLLTLSMGQHQDTAEVTVHDAWTSDPLTTRAMLDFLSRHHRAAAVTFRRSVLPPAPLLLHHLSKSRIITRSWNPWMLRILDPEQALRARGWPADLDFTLTLEIDRPGTKPRTYQLHVQDGAVDVSPTPATPCIRLTAGQLAVWYAGGYRSAAAARLGGVNATSPSHLETLIRAAAAREPWLPDQF